jgi:excisionase family DNA binding protein
MPRSPKLMTWAEAAETLGISVRTLQRIKAAGEIGFTPIKGVIYFSPEHVDDYIESQRVSPTVEHRRRKAS